MSVSSSLLIACVLLAAGRLEGARAATLRPLGLLGGPTVRLSDIWDDAGPNGARLLGPGPAPGGRITVGAEQLGAIARAYGIDWQPVSGAEQVVLERPGAPLPLASVTALLRPALAAQGAGPDFDIALPFFDPPMLPAGSVPRLSVEAVALQAGRFTATLLVDAGDQQPLRLALAGSVAASVAVLVPTRRLLPGAIVARGDMIEQRLRATLVTADVVQDPAQAVGMQLRHMEFPGQPVPLADLQHPSVIAKGDRVMMGLAIPGLDVGASGLALEGGAVGDRITVRNPVSGAVLTAAIVGPGQVQVDPGAPAVLPPGQRGFTLAAR